MSPTTTVESRENMIVKMFRRFNAGIVHFIMSIKLRAVGATTSRQLRRLEPDHHHHPDGHGNAGRDGQLFGPLGARRLCRLLDDGLGRRRLGGAENRQQMAGRHHSRLRRPGHRPALYRRRHRHGDEPAADRRRRGPALRRHRRPDHRRCPAQPAGG